MNEADGLSYFGAEDALIEAVSWPLRGGSQRKLNFVDSTARCDFQRVCPLVSGVDKTLGWMYLL